MLLHKNSREWNHPSVMNVLLKWKNVSSLAPYPRRHRLQLMYRFIPSWGKLPKQWLALENATLHVGDISGIWVQSLVIRVCLFESLCTSWAPRRSSMLILWYNIPTIIVHWLPCEGRRNNTILYIFHSPLSGYSLGHSNQCLAILSGLSKDWEPLDPYAIG